MSPGTGGGAPSPLPPSGPTPLRGGGRHFVSLDDHRRAVEAERDRVRSEMEGELEKLRMELEMEREKGRKRQRQRGEMQEQEQEGSTRVYPECGGESGDCRDGPGGVLDGWVQREPAKSLEQMVVGGSEGLSGDAKCLAGTDGVVESQTAIAIVTAASVQQPGSHSDSDDDASSLSAAAPGESPRRAPKRASAAKGEKKIRRALRAEREWSSEDEWTLKDQKLPNWNSTRSLLKKGKGRDIKEENHGVPLHEAAPLPKKKKGVPKGFVQIDKWNAHLERLSAFKEEHGHCDVPHFYARDKRLGTWVSDQRTQHRMIRQGKPSRLSPEQIKSLSIMGFRFSIVNYEVLSWDARLEQLAVYQRRHGHCNIPQYCKDKDCPPGLGAWVHEQRRWYKQYKENGVEKTRKGNTNGRSMQEQIYALEALGFVWQLRKRRSADRVPKVTRPMQQPPEMQGQGPPPRFGH